jgi:hypothetical protein
MASMFRRAAGRAVLAGGAAVVAILLARECESGHAHEVTIVVDPRPMGEGVRAVRVDVFDRAGERGSIERRFGSGEVVGPVRMRSSAPGAGGEIHVEIDTDDGLRRVRRPLEVAPGSTVTLRLGAGDVTP